MSKRISEQVVMDMIEGSRVVILGGGPEAEKIPTDYLEGFDIIVRMNNYRHFGYVNRTDIYYSYFGRNIKKTTAELKQDEVKLLFCKYPDADFTSHADGKAIQGYSEDFRWVYELRKDWWEIPYYVQNIFNFLQNFKRLNRIPTTGMSAIMDILRYQPKELYITGFDFFKSGLHHGEPWKMGDGNHDLEGERKLMGDIIFYHDNVSVDRVIQEAVE